MVVSRLDTGRHATEHGLRASAVVLEIENQIAEAQLPPRLSQAVRAQFGTANERVHDSCSRFGLLTVYAFESAGGDPPDDAAPAAAAVELAAAAASVLDDLQDLDEVPEVDKASPGAGAELVALLLVLSQRAMAMVDPGRIPHERITAAQNVLSHFELKALIGQHRSNVLGQNKEVNLEEATDALAGKSGAFGQLAAQVGASLATEDPSLVADHGEFGRHVAIIGQLENDVAGIWPGGEPSTDILLERQTPPVVFALQVPEGVSRAADEVKAALRAGRDGVIDESEVRRALYRSGAVHYAWIVAGVHRARASRIARAQSARNPQSRMATLLGA